MRNLHAYPVIRSRIADRCRVLDTLTLARELHPGSATASTRSASDTASIVRIASITALRSMRASSPTFIWR
jgi:DNA polymerase III epsilon subunit-like protein